MTLTVDEREVGERLAEPIGAAEAGRQIVILRDGEPIAKLEKCIRVPNSLVEEKLLWREEDRRRLYSSGDYM